MPDPDPEHIHCDSGDWEPLLKSLDRALRGNLPPGEELDSRVSDPGWRILIDEIVQIADFTRQLAEGDLKGELRVRGRLAGNLKALQANLRHLTWQVQQVAAGNLSQHVEFMGEFSVAFNQMISNLAQARTALQVSEARYRSVVEASPDDITITDPQGIIQLISPAAMVMFGFNSANEAVGRLFLDYISPVEREQARQIILDRTQEDTHGEMEFHAVHKDGSLFDIGVRSRAILDEKGENTGVVIIARDITPRKYTEKAEADQRSLAEALRDVAAALNSALSLDEVIDVVLQNLGRVVAHDALDIMLIENGFARIVSCAGYDRIVPGSQKDLMRFKFSLTKTANIQAMMESHQICLVDDIQNYTWQMHEKTKWTRSYLGAPILIKGKVVGFLGLLSAQPGFFKAEDGNRLMAFANLTAAAIEKARLFEQLKEIAITDPLTRAVNRREFFIRGEQELKRANRYNGNFSVLMLDLDNLKHINDTYGHATGDLVLRSLAKICRSCVRKIDCVARFGGDEFAILLPETSANQAQNIIERLREQIANLTIESAHATIGFTVSIGISEYQKTDTLQSLLERADRGLYQAKATGRNRTVISETDNQT